MGKMASGIGNLAGGAGGTTSRTIGGIASYNAANSANRWRAANAKEGQDFYQSQQDLALGRLDPYADVGEQAQSSLSGLLLGKQYDPKTGEFKDINTQEQDALFQKSPGYQFRMDQGMRGMQYQQNAGGSLLGGGALKELSQYNQGLASDEFSNYINQLSDLSRSGQTAATNQMGTQVGGLSQLTGLYMGGQQSAVNAQQRQNLSNLYQSQGEIQAQHHENAGRSLGQMFGGSNK